MVSRRRGCRIFLVVAIGAACKPNAQAPEITATSDVPERRDERAGHSRTGRSPEGAPEFRCPPDTAGMKLAPEPGLLCLDLSEVTVADYEECVSRGACTEPKPYDPSIRPDRYRALCNWRHPEGRDRHPINCLTYDQAKIYCSFRGARLPTDVEWAAAASNGGRSAYPWGESRPDGTRANGCGRECPAGIRRLVGHADVRAQHNTDDGFVGTAPVGAFPKGDNALGVHDLAGNVAELVVPVGAPESAGDLTAGGGFLTQKITMMSARVQTRTAWAGAASPDLGFRCIADAAVGQPGAEGSSDGRRP